MTSGGFVRSRSMSGTRPVLQTFPVALGPEFRPGDPVGLNSAGALVLVTASTTAGFLGIIDSCYGPRRNPLDGYRALTFNQPDRGPFLTSGQTGFAKVCTSTDQLYLVTIDTSASAGLVGQSIHVSAGAGNRAGRSGYSLRGASLGTGLEQPFQIVGISPVEEITGAGIDVSANSKVEVKMIAARHVFTDAPI